MSVFRYKLRTLLVVLPALAIAGAGLFQLFNTPAVYDVTIGEPAVCAVHKTVMTKKIVDLTYGMKWLDPMIEARTKLFPHADEIFDTGFCMGMVEEKARVHVCPDCSKARTVWLRGNRAK